MTKQNVKSKYMPIPSNINPKCLHHRTSNNTDILVNLMFPNLL